MTSLAEIQDLFRDAVFETDAEQPAMNALSQHIDSTPGLSSIQHLEIYRRTVIGTLQRALGEIYPVCRRLVGEQFFAGMARIFARQYPSESPDLADYGKQFDAFITTFEPARELPYLADVARLEWCWHRAFHAPDEPALDPNSFSAVPVDDIERIVFWLPRSARLLQSVYPVEQIWKVNQPDWKGDLNVDLDHGGLNMIIWRQGNDMRIDELNDAAWDFLRKINDGAAMADLTRISSLDKLLPDCVQHGWIGGFRLTARGQSPADTAGDSHN
jgi:hypothetical protein